MKAMLMAAIESRPPMGIPRGCFLTAPERMSRGDSLSGLPEAQGHNLGLWSVWGYPSRRKVELVVSTARCGGQQQAA